MESHPLTVLWGVLGWWDMSVWGFPGARTFRQDGSGVGTVRCGTAVYTPFVFVVRVASLGRDRDRRSILNDS